jgi:NAD(P)-dependent dehydrogenase (short-subunit alcohol dehydrogenase family)
MTQTVLITGASTGIGLATAMQFQKQGWNVVATMRSPNPTSPLATLDHVLCCPLDVTIPESIQSAVEAALVKFGAIDVLVNNAGYGLVGPFEAATPEQIEKQFATNVFGLMAVTRAILPHFRSQNSGTIVNVASIGGRMAFPLYSLYHATKWAVEGFSDSLQYELEPFNIRVKVIEPGPIKTDFYQRSPDRATGIAAYDRFVNHVLPRFDAVSTQGSPPEVTAEAIYRAAIDPSKRLRYPAGGNAGFLLFMRKFLPDSAFGTFIRNQVIGKLPQ